MAFKSPIWYPIALVLSVVNLAGVPFAVMPGEPWHATAHAAAALGFGLWAQRLRARRLARREAALPAGEQAATLDLLEAEVDELRAELGEAQERLDFAERLLAQRPREERSM